MTKPGIIIKIQLLQSSAGNYLESKERFFLETVLLKLKENTTNELTLTYQEKDMLESIFNKYKKYL